MKSYSDRIALHQHPIAQRLLGLMDTKKTNLALAADVTTSAELIDLANIIGPEICILKTHIDIIRNFDFSLIRTLKKLAQQHQFLIFEDRKFADIGQTVLHQYQDGIYRIAEWADIINAHALPGPGILQGLKKVGLPLSRGCLLLAQMSSAGHLFSQNYIQNTLKMAEENRDFVFGFIAQQRLVESPDFIYMTPGIHLTQTCDDLNQGYRDPYKVIAEYGSDVMIVGRGIYHAPDPLAAARQFREMGWQGYLERCHPPEK
ncbi:MAG: orotidine-5'-phosphate decarboxylase [Gammaproteobacteria bacterium]